jgi:RecA/RadA recombinase
MERLNYRDFFDFDDQSPLTDAIALIERLENVYRTMVRGVARDNDRLETELSSVRTQAQQMLESVQSLNVTYEQNQQQLAETARQSRALVTQNDRLNQTQAQNTRTLNTLNQSLETVTRSNRDLTKVTQDQAGSLNDLRRQLRDAERDYRELGDAVDDSIREDSIQRVRDLAQQYNTANRALNDARRSADAAAGSYNELNQFVLQGRRRLKELEGGLEGNSEEFRTLQQEVREARDRLAEWDAEIGDNFRNVGNYRQGVSEAVQELNLFQSVSDGLGSQLGILNQIYAAVSAGVRNTSESLNAASVSGTGFARTLGVIRTALAATGIGLIVLALGSLVGFLTQTQVGGNQLADVFSRVSAVFDVVTGRIFRVVEALFNLGGVISDLITGDISFGRAAQEALQAFDQIGSAFDGVTEEINTQIDAYLELNRLERQLAIATRELRTEIERQNTVAETQNIIADDATRSFAEREAASERARVAARAAAQAELELARQEQVIADARVENARRVGQINNELLDAQAEAVQASIAAERELLTVQLQNEQQRRQLVQDRLERDLDILIDGLDNQLVINERIRNDERTTLRVRRENLDETERLTNDSFARQISTIQQFTDARINANELLAESDAVQLNARIRDLGLSEIIEGRLLEVIRERRLVIQDLAEAERDLADASIERLEMIADNESLSLEERTNALLEIGEVRTQSLEDALDRNLLSEQEFATEVERIQQDLADRIAQLNLERAQAIEDRALLEAETQQANELTALNEQFQNDEISSIAEFERRREEIERESLDRRLEQQLDFLEQRAQLLRDSGMDTTEIDNEIANVRLQIAQRSTQQQIAQEQRLQQALGQLRQVAVDSALSILDNFNEQADERRQAELERINEQREAELEAAGDNADRRAAVEAKFAAEEDRIREEQRQANRRRAIFEKALAATQIAVDTGRAIVAAVAASPLTGGLPFSAINAAIGAAQLAAVLAQPIPEFWKGTMNSPEGWALINERGPELMEKNGSKVIYNTKGPTLVHLDKGTRIYDADTTRKMMHDAQFHAITKGYNEGAMHVEVRDSTDVKKELHAGFQMLNRTMMAQRSVKVQNNISRQELRWLNYINKNYR